MRPNSRNILSGLSQPSTDTEGMCGRQGIYRVDAESLKALEFHFILIN